MVRSRITGATVMQLNDIPFATTDWYQVADNAEPHRSSTAVGAKLFVVD
jgi:hypothetical protein